MKENIKIALLALISVTLIINTFMKGDSTEQKAVRENKNVAQSQPQANPSVVMPVEDGIVANDPIVDSKPKTVMVFDTYDYDFGDIDQDRDGRLSRSELQATFGADAAERGAARRIARNPGSAQQTVGRGVARLHDLRTAE